MMKYRMKSVNDPISRKCITIDIIPEGVCDGS